MIKTILLTPFQKFVKIESFSGILLLVTTIIALVWANSPWGEVYSSLWQFEIGITSSYFELKKPLLLWINDGFMAIFFFLIGLEIKRELLIGELNSAKKMVFPLVGAIGGMAIPVLFYVFLNENPETFKGWGIPMATDIAFSLAILNLLGSRVPLSLKIFLTAFAIVDDIGAVLAIAIFYSSNIDLTMLGSAFVLLGILYALSYRGFFSKFLLVVFGAIVWTLFLKSGIHPTLAGILLAFSVPIQQKIETHAFIDNLEAIIQKIKGAKRLDTPILSREQIAHIDDLENWTDRYQSPLQHLEHGLHDWVAYFIIPLFALANAGVIISADLTLDTAMIVTLVVCLVLGKGLGITAVVFIAQKLKIIEIPKDLRPQHIVGVAFLAGIGFTMSIFIGSLAFADSPMYIDSAKIGILIGSFVSAILGYAVLRFTKRSDSITPDLQTIIKERPEYDKTIL
ncbi:Na+/H+ antiporter NhaA [Maribacter chungangensis]|uniref:Na(+)/H(+) antiporter NhaA n=1 Tax=Maribacter chungangensis TaxID=1069117 RepID=A0ABW3B787_9FLAO